MEDHDRKQRLQQRGLTRSDDYRRAEEKVHGLLRPREAFGKKQGIEKEGETAKFFQRTTDTHRTDRSEDNMPYNKMIKEATDVGDKDWILHEKGSINREDNSAYNKIMEMNRRVGGGETETFQGYMKLQYYIKNRGQIAGSWQSQDLEGQGIVYLSRKLADPASKKKIKTDVMELSDRLSEKMQQKKSGKTGSTDHNLEGSGKTPRFGSLKKNGEDIQEITGESYQSRMFLGSTRAKYDDDLNILRQAVFGRDVKGNNMAEGMAGEKEPQEKSLKEAGNEEYERGLVNKYGKTGNSRANKLYHIGYSNLDRALEDKSWEAVTEQDAMEHLLSVLSLYTNAGASRSGEPTLAQLLRRLEDEETLGGEGSNPDDSGQEDL